MTKDITTDERMTANQTYGRLIEGVHIAGYTFERAFANLEWLIAEDDRWQRVGAGYEDISAFIGSVRLDQYRVVAEQRKRIANRIKELQPKASNRAIAKTLGVSEPTVRRDTASNDALPNKNANEINSGKGVNPSNGAPAVAFAEAAEAVAGAAARQERKARKNATKSDIINAVFSEDGPFGTVVIDPPWPVEKIDRDVRPNQAEFAYPTMSEDQIAAFWYREMVTRVENDCHLFMWTTQKWLPAAFRLVSAFSFRYVLTMVWHKLGGFQPVDLPQFNCEFVVYARRGSPLFVDTKDFNCCFDGERREHSRKPDKFYDTVRRVTGGSRIDVFSREPREGFAQYGNEPGKFASVTEAAE